MEVEPLPNEVAAVLEPGPPLEARAAAEPPAVLEARELVRIYGAIRAADGLSLTVRDGDIYGFLGRNGAGKTTAIRMFMGIIRPDAGTIAIRGEVSKRLSLRHKQQIGYVAQEQHFYPWMTCRALGDFVAGLYPSWDDQEFERLLRAFDLPADRKSSELSQGMRVKLALALAIAPRPPLLILDEPTAGLDPVARREFLEIVRHQVRTSGQTVFFSSHLMDEVERLADRVGIIERGRLVFEGTLTLLRQSVRRVGPFEVPTPPPPGLSALPAAIGGTTWVGPPEAWAAYPELSSQTLGLDDIFIALVGRASG